MTPRYRCDFCNAEFGDTYLCKEHEMGHYIEMSKEDAVIHYCRNYGNHLTPCDFCVNCFLVYGCEADCEYKDKCGYLRGYPLLKVDENNHLLDNLKLKENLREYKNDRKKEQDGIPGRKAKRVTTRIKR